jgi:hypothetical protein
LTKLAGIVHEKAKINPILETASPLPDPLPAIIKTRDNGLMLIVPRGVTNQAALAAAVADVEQKLAPDVVRIRYTIGTNWSGDEVRHSA